MLWLHLGNELGLFDDEDAGSIWNDFKPQFTKSLHYVNKIGVSDFFSDEVRVLLTQLELTDSISSARYAQRLSTKLIDTRGLELLLHEIGEQFRDATFTRHIVFDTPAEWEDHFEQEPDANVILNADSLVAMNALFAAYLRFIEHMGAMGQFFRQMEEGAESTFSSLEVERRIRAIHNWRLDLHNDDTRSRFIHLTATFLSSVAYDDELANLGFDVASLLARIEFLCAEWTGDSQFRINLPIPGGRRTANG
ncbi:MAG: hypothetical protein WB558_04920 [Terriglobales bacterium]